MTANARMKKKKKKEGEQESRSGRLDEAQTEARSNRGQATTKYSINAMTRMVENILLLS